MAAPIAPARRRLPSEGLFAAEEGGVEPIDVKGVYPGLQGFTNHGGSKPGPNAFQDRGIKASFGMEDLRPEPAGPSKAIRDAEPAHLAQLPPEDPSRPSWVDFAGQKAENEVIQARNQGQLVKAEEQQARTEAANAETMAAQRKDLELSALQRRQALVQAFEETTGQPFSEKALAEEMKRKYEAGEKDMILADIFAIFEDEEKDIAALGPGPEGDRKKALIREHYRELRDRLQNVRTNRAVQLSKQPDPPATDESIEAILSRGGS